MANNNNNIAFIVLFLHCVLFTSIAKQTVDVRRHLSTVTRYEASKGIKEYAFDSSKIPDHCFPIHLNLVARHGTRAPTKKRMRDLEILSVQLKSLLHNAKEKGSSLEKLPSWLWGWSSPWMGKIKGGELIIHGEEEMYNLGIGMRERFQELFRDDYHPDIY